MAEHETTSPHTEKGIIYAPWERAFDRVLTPFDEFIHRQTTSGLLLMVSAIVALVLANSFAAEAYLHLLHTPLGIHVGAWSISMSLHHWVNDGLMALFFFVVGMELKREMLVGELADLRQAALPIVAAIGGMVMPALIYLAINHGTDAARGWGIPMATDIAFAVGALVLLASRVPKALITFLVALAIADDLGAVVVIALFYTQQLALDWLAVSVILVLLLFVLNFAGIRKVLPYFGVAILLWYVLLQSGVHATLAGVLCAFAIPARPKYDPVLFSGHIKELVGRFDASHQQGGNIMTNETLYSVVQTLERGVRGVQTPLQRLEHSWHLPVAFLVIPIFALTNAGIPLQLGALGETLAHPVMSGVLLGLVLGKFIGITGACWLALRLGIAQLPSNTRFSQIAAVSLLGGIGFTMSIFIAELGFATQPEYLLIAKTGVLVASLLAGMLGFAWLWQLGRKP
ncbi:MAG: Na+/H+ antiporter NhaA [Gallionella sp.]|nr:Na+/H+ antiporter NhaA [Gallionella sp.]